MNPTPVEAAVLARMAESTPMPELAAQLREAVILSREFSGAGSYTTLSVPSEAPSIPLNVELIGRDGPIDGPDVESPELPWPACTLLWLNGRKAAVLEIAGTGIVDTHPKEFTLSSAPSDA
jgi:hypothetical protein